MGAQLTRFRLRHWLAVAAAMSLAAACGTSADSPGGSSDSSSALEPSTDDGSYDVLRYDLSGELDWTRNRLVATVGVTLRLLDPHASAVVLDSAVTEVKAVRLAGKALGFAVDTEKQQLRIELPPRTAGTLRFDIDYQAEASSIPSGETFSMVPALKGDPTPVRAAFTFSEPYGARLWMPCHDQPSDRAHFSIEMRVAAIEQLLANGDLVSDRPEPGGGAHRVKYESGFTLPTYLMAFAVSDFDVPGSRARHLPLYVWHRRGIPNDDALTLSETARHIETFEKLLGPYPFDKYSQVFMPGDWGEENATMTLVSESSLDYSSYTWSSQAAHELAHQWFGDLVTVRTFYDAWFKEGMATLLQSEALRMYSDQDGHGTLGNEGLGTRPVSDGDPIVRDRSLPAFPYNQGPYIRAQWLLSQIRSILGEDAFWGTLRGVLRQYRYGTIDTEQFIAGFAPALGPELTAAVRRAVYANRIPRLHLEPSPSGVFATLTDPDGSLITPVVVRWIAPDGSTRDQTLALGTKVDISPQRPGEFLILDPRDVHPALKLFAAADGKASGAAYTSSMLPLMVPKGDPAISQFLQAGGVHQFSLLRDSTPALRPETFESFLHDLDSASAKAFAVQRGCEAANAPGVDADARAAWSEALSRVIGAPLPERGVFLTSVNYKSCLKVIDVEKVFADDWTKLASGYADGVSAERVSYLLHFPGLSPARALSIWSGVATRARSLTVRALAMNTLVNYASSMDPADMAPWRSFFVDQLTATETGDSLNAALYGVLSTAGATAADNAAALAGLDAVLHDPNDYYYAYNHSDAVCAAYALIPGAPSAPEWQSFVAGLADAKLKSDIRALVDDPSPCADGLPY